MVATKKPAAKPAAKKTTTTKTAAKKTTTTKPAAKKTTTAKPAVKKTTVAKSTTTKTTTKPAAKKVAPAKTAVEISVNGNKKIGTLMKEFNKQFPYIRLGIFYSYARQEVAKGGTIYNIDADKTLASVRRADSGGDISISGNKKINWYCHRVSIIPMCPLHRKRPSVCLQSFLIIAMSQCHVTLRHSTSCFLLMNFQIVWHDSPLPMASSRHMARV